MQSLVEETTKPSVNDRVPKSDNGLQSLVIYYQKLIDIEENVNHYSPSDYLNAKRNFVKYLLEKELYKKGHLVFAHIGHYLPGSNYQIATF